MAAGQRQAARRRRWVAPPLRPAAVCRPSRAPKLSPVGTPARPAAVGHPIAGKSHPAICTAANRRQCFSEAFENGRVGRRTRRPEADAKELPMPMTPLRNAGSLPPIILLAAACLVSWAASPAPTLAGDCHHCWTDPGDGYLGLAAQACGSSFLTCGQGVYENPWDMHAHVWDGYCGGTCKPCSNRPGLCCKCCGSLKTLLPGRCHTRRRNVTPVPPSPLRRPMVRRRAVKRPWPPCPKPLQSLQGQSPPQRPRPQAPAGPCRESPGVSIHA